MRRADAGFFPGQAVKSNLFLRRFVVPSIQALTQNIIFLYH